MRKSLILAASAAGSMLALTPLAQAQPMPDHRMDETHRMDRDHRMDDRRPDYRPGTPAGRPRQLSQEQSLRVRSALGDLNNQLLQAQRARRVTNDQAVRIRGRIANTQRAYSAWARGGLDINEYNRINSQIVIIRNEIRRAVAVTDQQRARARR